MRRELEQQLAGLKSLSETSRLDMKPVMMRVLTDLFVSKPHHAPDDVVQFAEISARILDQVDEDTLELVARKLGPHPQTPDSLRVWLMHHGGRTAAALIETSKDVDRAQLMAAANGAAPLAEAAARRADLDAQLVSALVRRPENSVALALTQNSAVALGPEEMRGFIQRARNDKTLAHALMARGVAAHDAAPLFLHASAELRGEILRAAREIGQGAIGAVDDGPLSPALMDIEKAACGRDWSRFAFALSLRLGVRIEEARKIMGDASGEALALALAAIEAPTSLVTRIFLCREPAIAHSYSAVRKLADLAESVTTTEARRIIESICGPQAQTRPARGHAPQYDQTAATRPSRAAPAPLQTTHANPQGVVALRPTYRAEG